MDAAAVEAGIASPATAAAAGGHAPGLGSPVLLHSGPSPAAAAACQPAGVSQQTPGLVPHGSGAATAAAPAAAAMVPVAALGGGAAQAAEAKPSELFYSAREAQTRATGASARPTPQSTAATRAKPALQPAAAADVVAPAAAAAGVAAGAAAVSAAIARAGADDAEVPAGAAPAAAAAPAEATAGQPVPGGASPEGQSESEASFAFHRQGPASAAEAAAGPAASGGAPTPELPHAAAAPGAPAAVAPVAGPMAAGAGAHLAAGAAAGAAAGLASHALLDDGGFADYGLEEPQLPEGAEADAGPRIDWSGKSTEEIVSRGPGAGGMQAASAACVALERRACCMPPGAGPPLPLRCPCTAHAPAHPCFRFIPPRPDRRRSTLRACWSGWRRCWPRRVRGQ